MPVYELEILEPAGGVTRGEHVSPDRAEYSIGDRFEYDGRTLKVKLLETLDQTDRDQRLVCIPE
jgi:hypothetical protein